MKRSKLKEFHLIKNKVYLYITPNDIYLRIDKIERRSGIKIHRIKHLFIIQLIRNFIKKVRAYIYLLEIEDLCEDKKNVKSNNKNKYSNNKNKNTYYKNTYYKNAYYKNKKDNEDD